MMTSAINISSVIALCYLVLYIILVYKTDFETLLVLVKLQWRASPLLIGFN